MNDLKINPNFFFQLWLTGIFEMKQKCWHINIETIYWIKLKVFHKFLNEHNWSEKILWMKETWHIQQNMKRNPKYCSYIIFYVRAGLKKFVHALAPVYTMDAKALEQCTCKSKHANFEIPFNVQNSPKFFDLCWHIRTWSSSNLIEKNALIMEKWPNYIYLWIKFPI